MKTNKIILSMAVAAALPFAANATQTIVQTQTPAAVGANGTVKKAATVGPYVTNEPTVEDQTHIATTAYVKGAYNDAIAAVNKVDADKQAQLVVFDTNSSVGTNVVGANDEIVLALHQQVGNGEFYNETMNELLPEIEQAMGIDYSDSLITAEAAIKLYAILMEFNEFQQAKLSTRVNNQDQNISSTIAQTVNTTTPSATTLVSEAAIASAINGQTTALNSKRVTVYTTWGVDDGTAVTQVPFSTAQ